MTFGKSRKISQENRKHVRILTNVNHVGESEKFERKVGYLTNSKVRREMGRKKAQTEAKKKKKWKTARGVRNRRNS